MSTIADATSAILDWIRTNLTAWPVVWPNEVFDPANPPSSGHLSGFPANSDHVVVSFETIDARQETHGHQTGYRGIGGEVLFWIKAARNKGPKDAAGMASTITTAIRNLNLLSDQVQFGEPVPEEIGELDGWYVWRLRVPYLYLFKP